MVHQLSFSTHLASSAVTPVGSVHKSRRDYVDAVEEMMCVVCVLQRGHSGDECDFASTLCKYDLFVLSWGRVQRGRRRCAQYFVIASCG